MRAGQMVERPSIEECAFRRQLEEMDFDNADGTPFGVFADWQDEHDRPGEGYRLIAGCIRSGSLCAAYRVEPHWEEGMSPLELANLLRSPRTHVASGGCINFVCGSRAREVITRSPLVEKFDSYPAIRATPLSPLFQTPIASQLLRANAFDTANLY